MSKISFSDSKCHGEIDDQLPKEFRDYVDNNAEQIAKAIEVRAKASTEFKDETGYLRSHIKAQKSKYEDGGWIVIARAPHAWLVEYGHDIITRDGRSTGKRAKASPYLRPALESEISDARAKFGVK